MRGGANAAKAADPMSGKARRATSQMGAGGRPFKTPAKHQHKAPDDAAWPTMRGGGNAAPEEYRQRLAQPGELNPDQRKQMFKTPAKRQRKATDDVAWPTMRGEGNAQKRCLAKPRRAPKRTSQPRCSKRQPSVSARRPTTRHGPPCEEEATQRWRLAGVLN